MFPTLDQIAGDVGPVDLDCLLAQVNTVDGAAADPVLIEQISALERLKAGCAAAQARLTAAFAAAQTAAAQTADGAARKIRPARSGVASPGRSPWPGGTPAMSAAGTSASPLR